MCCSRWLRNELQLRQCSLSGFDQVCTEETLILTSFDSPNVFSLWRTDRQGLNGVAT